MYFITKPLSIMKKSVILSALFIFFHSIMLHAQLSISYQEYGINDLVGRANTGKIGSGANSGISGSPYLDEDFQNGDVFYERKYKISNVPFRFNIFNDQIEYKNKNTILSFANPEKIDSIVAKDEIFIYLEKNERHKVRGFAKLWNQKYPAVLTKMKVQFYEKEELQGFSEPKPDRFEREMDRHYLIISKDDIEVIKSVKKLIAALGDHSSELTSFAKKEKISTGDPEELAKLLDYYHELE